MVVETDKKPVEITDNLIRRIKRNSKFKEPKHSDINKEKCEEIIFNYFDKCRRLEAIEKAEKIQWLINIKK